MSDKELPVLGVVQLPDLSIPTKHRHKARITLVHTVYHQRNDRQPNSRGQLNGNIYVNCDDEPYSRTLSIPNEGVPVSLDKGWLSRVGCVHLLADETKVTATGKLPPCLDLCYLHSENERHRDMYSKPAVDLLFPMMRLSLGNPLFFECCDFDKLRVVNRTSGPIELSYTLYGR